MTSFSDCSLMCKCMRAVRLYKSVYDNTPSSTVLCEGTKFISKKCYRTDTLVYYHISKVVDEDLSFEGLWCPASAVGVVGVETKGTIVTPDEGQHVVAEEVTSGGAAGVENLIRKSRVMAAAVRAAGVSASPKGANERTQSYNTSSAGQRINTAVGSYRFPTLDLTGQPVTGYRDAVNYGSPGSSRSVSEILTTYGSNYRTSTNMVSNAPIGRMIFVHGMPFQYNNITDRRNGASSLLFNLDRNAANSNALKGGSPSEPDLYGRTYAKDIAANMPIVVITPGTPKFLSRVSTGIFGTRVSATHTALEAFLPAIFSASDGTNTAAEAMADTSGEYDYYSLVINTADYYKYVNALCCTSARLMGLNKEFYSFRRSTPDKMDWGLFNTAAQQDYSVVEEVVGGLRDGISFAYDPAGSINDTISNSTTRSQFEQFFNNFSSQARELDFIMGTVGSSIDLFDTNAAETGLASMSTGAFSGMKNVMNRLVAWGKNTAHGMNIRFPEIWDDSSNSRSYELDMHFIAPYATNYCKWRYVLVPFFHIFALAAPKSEKNNSQYASPFLVKVYSRGYFNVEMGIIESITWKRFGDGDMISADGIPLQIDVSIQFKDLYHTLAMTTAGTNAANFFNNTGLMDLVGTLSGVNMNRLDPAERLELFAAQMSNTFTMFKDNFMRSIEDRIHNGFQRILGYR